MSLDRKGQEGQGAGYMVSRSPKFPLPFAICLAATAVALTALHVWLIAPVLQNGDAAVYAEQIENGILTERTTHIGYMAFGIGFNRVLPFEVERNLNLMCLVFGVGGCVALATIAKKLDVPALLALATAPLTLAIEPYLRGSLLSEVDVVAGALVLMALALWMHASPFRSGLALGYAMLVTPLAALSLPLFLPIESKSPWLGLRNVVRLGLGASIVYVPPVVWNWRDYFYGGRGILHAPREPWSLIQQCARSLHFFTATATPWLVLGLAGLVFATYKRCPLGRSVLLAIVLAVFAGERFRDVPVQLTNLCLLMVYAVAAISRLQGRLLPTVVVGFVWLLSAIPSYGHVTREIEAKKRSRAIYLEMANQTPQLIVVGFQSSWDDGLLFERIVYHKTKLGLGLESRQFVRAAATLARTHPHHAIWLLAPMSAEAMAPFRAGWQRQVRHIGGRSYEVWTPTELGPLT